jgi:hypothetical protein
MEIWKTSLFKIYNSTTLSLSKALSNYFNFSSKLRSLSIKFVKLEGGFTTYLTIIGSIFAHKNQFVQIF